MTLTARSLSVRTPGHLGRTILADVSLELADGKLYVVVGEMGAGKSTLLNALAGLVEPSSGSLHFDGHPVWQSGTPDRTFLLAAGFVFQSPESQLFAATVDKELTYSLKPYRLGKEESAERKEQALVAVDLPASLLAQSPATLSGGQKRRVAIASTSVTQPQWLFLDEPTAGLDPLALQGFVSHLQVLRAERAALGRGGIVVATHDLDALLPLADAVIVLQNGLLRGVYAPSELYKSPEVLEQAGIGLPEDLQLQAALAAVGCWVDVSSRASAEALASHIAAWNGPGEPATLPGERCCVDAPFAASAEPLAGEPTAPTPAPPAGLRALDVRCRWFCYLLLTFACLFQKHVPGLALATVVVLALCWAARVPLAAFKVIRPFVVMVLFSVALSGLEFHTSAHNWLTALDYSMARGGETFLAMYRIFLVVLLSVLLTATTSTLQIKQGLDSLWPRRWRRPAVWEALTLGAALTLRFIPVITREWQRFSLVVRARAKSTARPGNIKVRDIPAVTVPLLVACLQLGDALAVAMAARGYTRLGGRKPASRTSAWSAVDTWACLGVLVVFVSLSVFSKYVW